jgi:acetyl esterase/lipase
MFLCALSAGVVLAAASPARAQDAAPDAIRTYKTVDGTELKLHVFKPSATATTPRPAMVLLHGGGWNVGSPEWTYDRAKRYASRGMVAIGVQYRLSDFKTITPLDAMADTRDAIRWVRSHAGELGVDPRASVSTPGRPAATSASPRSSSTTCGRTASARRRTRSC